jgi:hypothetical protein
MELLVMKIKTEELIEKILKPNCKVFEITEKEIYDRDFNCDKFEGIPFTAVDNDNGSAWVLDRHLIYLN